MTNEATSIKDQLIAHCNITLCNIDRKITQLPTKNSCIIQCGNDVFDVLLLDTNIIATSHKTLSTIQIWDTISCSLLKSIDLETHQNWEMIRVSDSTILVGSYLVKRVYMINWRIGKIERTISIPASIMYYGHSVMKLFGTNQDILIAGLESNKLVICDLNDTFMTTFSGHTRGVTCVEIIPNGRIITGSWDCSLKIWDVSTSSCTATLKGHTGPVTSVKLLTNSLVVSGSYDYSIKLWNIDTNTLVYEIGSCNDWIREVLVLNSELVCTASDDKSVKIWNVQDRKCVKDLHGHTGCVHSVMLVDDQIISGSADGTVRVWSL